MTTTRPINLSEHEVLAALRGELGLVVRPVRPQPTMIMDMEPEGYSMVPSWDGETELHMSKCPLGLPGDRLRCKETWRVGAWRDYSDDCSKFAFDYQATPEIVRTPWMFPPEEKDELQLRERIFMELANKNILKVEGEYVWEPGKSPLSWRSAATMPAWASRITLEVVAVRCVRIDELRNEDFIACGFVPRLHDGREWLDLLAQFVGSWDRRHGKQYLYQSRPWVWAAKVKIVKAV